MTTQHHPMKWIKDPSENAGKTVDQILQESRDKMLPLPKEPTNRHLPWGLLVVGVIAVFALVMAVSRGWLS